MNFINKIKKIIEYPPILLLLLDKHRIITLRNEKFLKYYYKSIFKKELNLLNPQTFSEKIQWLKLNDKNDSYSIMVDKYKAKNYVTKIMGNEYIIPTIDVYDNFNEIRFDKLPNQFVIKCTHDSGGIVIVKDKSKIDKEKVKKKINKSLKHNYFYCWREWPYKNVKPRILIEKYMEQNEEKSLIDYKVMVFNGKAKCTFVCSDRDEKGNVFIDVYDNKWNKMKIERKNHKNSNKTIKKPINYELMIKYAEYFARKIPFLRVDFYEINNKLYFSEFTFYPASGFDEFKNYDDDILLGSWLQLPKLKEE